MLILALPEPCSDTKGIHKRILEVSNEFTAHEFTKNLEGKQVMNLCRLVLVLAFFSLLALLRASFLHLY